MTDDHTKKHAYSVNFDRYHILQYIPTTFEQGYFAAYSVNFDF
jgi:hypothetical protein